MKYPISILLAVSIGAFEVMACSVTRDYVRPSNFELVQITNTIIIGKVISGSREWNARDTKIEVIQVLKGQQLPKYIELGLTIGDVPPTVPDQIYRSHPYDSMCNRYEVSVGQSYVFFLNEYDGEIGFFNPPFSRIAEDYYGDDSLWMKAITYYLDIQSSHRPMAQLEALRQRYDAIQENSSATEHEKLLAIDIATHLMSRSPYKPTQYLIDSYQALANGEPLPFRVASPKTFHGNADVTGLINLLFDQKPLPLDEKQWAMESILWSLANGEHSEAKPFIQSLSRSKGLSSGTIGAIVKYLANNGEYIVATELVRKYGLLIAATKPMREVEEFVRGAFAIHHNPEDYKKPIWLNKPNVSEWWPEFHFAIVQIMNNRYGKHNWSLPDAVVEAIRPESYRENPELALTLVREHDDHVVEWASKELERLLSDDVDIWEDEYDLPTGIILEDYRPDNAGKVEELFCRSDDTRYLILKNLGMHVDLYTRVLIKRLTYYEGYDDEERNVLIKSLIRFEAKKDGNEVDIDDDLEWYSSPYSFLHHFMNGAMPNVEGLKPLMCQ